jgi:hypothetical protein
LAAWKIAAEPNALFYWYALGENDTQTAAQNRRGRIEARKNTLRAPSFSPYLSRASRSPFRLLAVVAISSNAQPPTCRPPNALGLGKRNRFSLDSSKGGS